MLNIPQNIIEESKTPLYFYDLQLLHRTLDEAQRCAGDFCVHYAVKANANARILQEIASRGFGADCVSGGEVKAAVAAGFAPEKIVFAGVGKTDDEIRTALSVGIGCLNVESVPELEVISEIASAMNVTARVAIRVNPNVDAHTHHYITTGLAENKFGINLEMLPSVIETAQTLPGIKLIGLHFHIGSQVLDPKPFAMLCDKINELQGRYASVAFESINVGGGLGIDYDNPDANPVPDFESYFEAYRKNLMLRPGQKVHFELGRSLVAQCGSLITRVTYVKEGTAKKFVIVDAGMSELLRPALYGAHHVIQNLSAAADAAVETYDVVGPICESSDVFAVDEKLPMTHRGDIIAMRSAGAYGEAMASNYNLRKLNPAIFLK
jgi:diaminopimelate decarboxylase